MEEVCLNRGPIFEEGYEYDDNVDCSVLGHCDEIPDIRLTKAFLQPAVGLEFECFDDAYDFYNSYAKGQGFGIRLSNSWFRSKQRERYRAKLSCSSAGFKKKTVANNPRPETRTGCPAMVIIKLVDTERWRVVDVHLEHNHQVSTDIKRFFKSHKKMFPAANKARQSEPVKEIHTIKLYHAASLNGLHNTANHPKHLALKEGDALALYNYFCRMKLMNPNFFYLLDLDDEGHLNNVFWADARSRIAYNYFSDAVIIDTKSLTDKYEIPLILFVGINHHGESVLLGCGFLGLESAEHFTWMFKAWLACMHGRHPQVIVTDRSKPMQLAVSDVFPRAHHCYCLYHIMQHVPEKLGGLNGFEAIKRQLKKAVYDSLKISDFETHWDEMITKHNLVDNKWLQLLYEDRKMWVPVYLKDTCFCGIFLINEDEGICTIFDGFVHKHTTFKEFLDKYDLALHRRHLKEAVEDFESRNSIFELKTKSSFELQLSKVYTKGIYRKWQIEVEGMQSCFNTKQVNSNGPIVTFVVKEWKEVQEKEEVRHYEVVYEAPGGSEVQVLCVCSLFNFRGYLCRHALSVLDYNGIEEIPSQYILARWGRNYKCEFGMEEMECCSGSLYRRGVAVVEEGVQSREQYEAVMREVGALLSKLCNFDC